MTADEQYAAFLTAPYEDQLQMIRDPEVAPVLRRRLGEAAYGELRRAADRVSDGPLLGGPDTNMIVVPGIMGSVLVSDGLGGIWWIDALRGRDRLRELALTPDGTADLVSDAEIVASTLDTVYLPFRTALRNRDDLGQVGYPYDWRRPIPAVTAGLAAEIESAYAGNGGRPVHLVGHSMGGLVIRATLMSRPDLWSKVGRIAFLATPHYGSPAIAGYLKHHFWGLNVFRLLGRYLTPSAFRSMWGALSLLPSPAGTYPGTRAADGDRDDPAKHPCANFDLYDAAAYRLDLTDAERQQLQVVLDHVAGFHRELAAWHQGLAQEQRDRMLVVAGVGQKTLFRLAYKAPVFGFGWERMDRVTSRVAGDHHREGDGRVPLASARLEHVHTRYVRSEHTAVATVPAVWDDVFAWFTGATLQLATTPQAALDAHLGSDESSAAPALAGRQTATRSPDEPGYLDFNDPTDEHLDVLDAGLSDGDVASFERLRLL
jgi:pimeloyl-ACP methyl ester carboxylesterase